MVVVPRVDAENLEEGFMFCIGFQFHILHLLYASSMRISRIILVYYCKCCDLIGYSTRYLSLI